MRKSIYAALVALLVLLGLGVAWAATGGLTTGTVTACAHAAVPAQTISDNGSPIATVPGDSDDQCVTTTYTIPTVTEPPATTTTATTTTTTASTTTTAAAAASFDQAVAYTATKPAFTVQRDVPVASASALQAAVSNIACGDYVHATAPFTVTGEWEITAAPSCAARVDLTGVTMSYGGSSDLPSVWLNGAKNLQLFGGDIHGNGGCCGGGVKVYTTSNVLWWGFHIHDVGGDGLDLFPIGGAIDGGDFYGEVDHWGGYTANDPHQEKGTGLHGANIDDSGTGIVTNTRVALDAHDGPTGAAVEIGVNSGGQLTGDTLILRAQHLTDVSTIQTGGNALNLWGGTPIHLDVPYIEGDDLQGRVVDAQGVENSADMSGVNVEVGRASNTNQNTQLENGAYPGVAFDPRYGVTYGDIGTAAPPTTTTTATTTTSPTTTTTTSGGTFSYALRQDFENGGSGPGSLLCGGATPPANGVWGTFANIASNGQGARAATFSLPADTSIKQRCQIDEVTHRALVMGSDEFFTLMLYVPAAAANNYPGTTAAWGPQLWEPEYQGKNSGQPSWTFDLQTDGVSFRYCTGNGPGCQYGGKPNEAQALPHGQLVAGWHEFIVHVHLSDTTSGQFEVWHRLKGSSAWTKTVDLTGLPTVQTPYSGNAYDVLQAYRGPASTPFSVTLDDFTRSTSFAAASAALP